MNEFIQIKGARVHNLKNISLKIPRDKLVVFTGPSGSGKSSLAFDIIYAEGQRRYVESLSSYARQFLEQISKPDIDDITGLSPTISIQQKTTSNNPRSTVGTVTEIYDFLRVLYARIGNPFCYSCGGVIQSQTPERISETVCSMKPGSRVAILAPIAINKKGEFTKELASAQQRGFVRARVNGEMVELGTPIKLDKNKKHNISIVVDRLIIKKQKQDFIDQVRSSVELALKLGSNSLIIEEISETGKVIGESFHSADRVCHKCNISYSKPEPRTFSFNSPIGWCPRCEGVGFDSFNMDDSTDFYFSNKPVVCEECGGARLKKESLSYLVNGKNIHELCKLSILEFNSFLKNLSLTERERLIVDLLIKEIVDRSQFLINVGVEYLDLSRPTSTLSGGESQRIRLASQIGSSLVGVIYVLDEPSIGLHPKDTDRLIHSLVKLKENGNTVLVVEHDKETIERADHIVDFGPGAGILGGEIISQGSLEEIKKSSSSITGKYLSGIFSIPISKSRKPFKKTDPKIVISGAQENNLKNITVDIPLKKLVCITGVSGGGKSTLVMDTLYPLLMNYLYGSKIRPIKVRSISGIDNLDKVVLIDQSPIGRTPRSNPATYTGIFSLIRDLFASLPESKSRGYQASRFSFNVGGTKGGRCASCEGDGEKKIEMHFLPDVRITCDVCLGKRYNLETLSVLYKNKSIADVLDMSITEALQFFSSIPPLFSKLKILETVGLGYLKLGQSSTTLSGGEAQRIKLAKELSKRSTGRTLYILDEPSTGLHFDDIKKLVDILHQLVNEGNSVLVIEHNLDIIKTADHIIDLGPVGGEGGGYILACGTPEEVVQNPKSVTGTYLANYLK